MSRVVCVGLATRDTIYAVPRLPDPDGNVVATARVVGGGGPAATAAVAIARLGVEVRFVGVIDGELDGVDVVSMPGRMVESTILVHDGNRAIVTEQPQPFTIVPEVLAGATWLHVDHVGHPALPRGVTTPLSVDAGHPIPNLSFEDVTLWGPREATDDGRRAKLTAVTRGVRGCVAYADGETINVPVFPVDVVSTLGAGDVFHGALLACLVRGEPLRRALTLANACAALSCRALDGRSAIPSWDELIDAESRRG